MVPKLRNHFKTVYVVFEADGAYGGESCSVEDVLESLLKKEEDCIVLLVVFVLVDGQFYGVLLLLFISQLIVSLEGLF